MADFRKRIFKNFKEDLLNDSIKDSNPLEKSSMSAAPMALIISNKFKIIKNNSDDDLHLPAPNPLETNLKSNNNFDITLENFENNKIINQLMDDFDNKNEENNSEDINFKQSKDEKINIYDDFDNDSEKIK